MGRASKGFDGAESWVLGRLLCTMYGKTEEQYWGQGGQLRLVADIS